jgi:hypothetical protein
VIVGAGNHELAALLLAADLVERLVAERDVSCRFLRYYAVKGRIGDDAVICTTDEPTRFFEQLLDVVHLQDERQERVLDGDVHVWVLLGPWNQKSPYHRRSKHVIFECLAGIVLGAETCPIPVSMRMVPAWRTRVYRSFNSRVRECLAFWTKMYDVHHSKIDVIATVLT